MLQGRRPITAVGLGEDTKQDFTRYFVIMPPFGEKQLEGIPSLCGNAVRLLHHKSLQWLRASGSESSTVHQREVYLDSDFASGGGHEDNWKIECENGTTIYHAYGTEWTTFKWDRVKHEERKQVVLKDATMYWKPDTAIRLLHIGSQTYLGSNENLIPSAICPSCAQKKLMEVVGGDIGHLLDPMVRWYVKDIQHAPFECNDSDDPSAIKYPQAVKYRGGMSMYKVWPRYRRMIRPGDFIAWRDQLKSSVACDNIGKIQIGLVKQLSPVTQSLIVEPWLSLSPEHDWKQIWVSRLPSELPTDASGNPVRSVVALPVSHTFGPLVHFWQRPDTGPAQLNDQGSRGLPMKNVRDFVKFYVKHLGDARGYVGTGQGSK